MPDMPENGANLGLSQSEEGLAKLPFVAHLQAVSA